MRSGRNNKSRENHVTVLAFMPIFSRTTFLLFVFDDVMQINE
jgi:hypothetical protein